MEEKKNIGKQGISRRKFIGTTVAASTAFALGSLNYSCKGSSAGKPNSRFGGVQIGAITYSWRSMPSKAEDVLRYCLLAGISSIELMSPVVEEFAGIPPAPVRPQNFSSLSSEEKAAFNASMKTAAEEQRKWRISASMKKFQEFRKMYNDAGVNIHIAKFSPAGWTDEEIDYAFKAAKALGAKGVCNEIGEEPARRLGKFAEKHGMYAIFHQHFQPAEPNFSFDSFLTYSSANMLNFDAGHYYGCTGRHPNEIMERLHDRIFSIHLKDKTGPKSDPPNTNRPWGQGEMPIADVLKLIQKQKWPIYCDIELEYPVPEGSDAALEVKKCVEFCRNILA